MYIVFEGIDGSGKTTLCDSLSELLIQRGFKVKQLSEPSRSHIGFLLREQMKNSSLTQLSLSLLFAADSYHVQAQREEIYNREYDYIISDRNYLSTLAYQMTEVDADWLITLHKYIAEPDYLFFLDVSINDAITRIGQRNYQQVYENRDMLTRIKHNYDISLGKMKLRNIYRLNTSELSIQDEINMVLKCLGL